MKVVVICGDSPRHCQVAREVAETGALSGLIVERRECHVPDPPSGLAPSTEDLFVRHFKDRAAAEYHFFGAPELPASVDRRLTVTPETLNASPTHKFLQEIRPDLIISYGCHKLTAGVLALGSEAWNIHGGLSPWYRGAITHFWPSYMLEPQMTGVTIHETTADIDGGDVVHQVVAPLVRGDGVHDIACRAVYQTAREMSELIDVASRRRVEKKNQRTSGKIWTAKDWRPEHLHVIYDLYENSIVDRQLDGLFSGRNPMAHRQF